MLDIKLVAKDCIDSSKMFEMLMDEQLEWMAHL